MQGNSPYAPKPKHCSPDAGGTDIEALRRRSGACGARPASYLSQIFTFSQNASRIDDGLYVPVWKQPGVRCRSLRAH